MVCFVCVHCLDGAPIPKFAMTWLTLVSGALVSVGWVVPPKAFISSVQVNLCVLMYCCRRERRSSHRNMSMRGWSPILLTFKTDTQMETK